MWILLIFIGLNFIDADLVCSGYYSEASYLSDFTQDEKFTLFQFFNKTNVKEKDFTNQDLIREVFKYCHPIMCLISNEWITECPCGLSLCDKDGNEQQITLRYESGSIPITAIIAELYESDSGRRVMRKLLKTRDETNGALVGCKPEHAAVLMAIFAKNANHEVEERLEKIKIDQKKQNMLADDIILTYLVVLRKSVK